MAEKRKYKKTKEEIRREIAREFDLPERKSKIATILKQDDQAYCICRTSDCSRFMIGCDGCEEWYHGDCIGITEKEAKHIKQYYCRRCKKENPDLQTIFRLVATERTAASTSGTNSGPGPGLGSTNAGGVQPGLPAPAVTMKRKNSNAREPKGGKRCGTCEGCRRPNCNQCDACRIRVGHKPRCIYRTCVVQAANAGGMAATTTTAAGRKREKATAKDRNPKGMSAPPVSPEIYINPELEGVRQCHGPSCRCQARPQSKYCSDKCGFNLATNRIFQVLPQRLQEWNLTPCNAAEENRTQLEGIRQKQSMVRFALAELEKRSDELNMVVDRAKRSSIDTSRQQDYGDTAEDEQSMYCITCGHEIHSRTAIKHMEKCFNKYESQASFGSIFKTRMEGNNMFCDFYNPASKTYCKRLRVLCPEHSKDPKVSDTDVCGAPLVHNVFNPTGEFCRAPKKNCFKHYAWEKIRRAEIDLERVRQWLKMDDLMEQERVLRQQLTSRANLLGLMLHSTYNHEVMDELVRKQQEHLAEFEKQKRRQVHHQQLQAHQQQLQAQQQLLAQQQMLQQQQQQKFLYQQQQLIKK
ncbi:uncharacterized protein Dwil_GK25558 [Drosophila willistoni]|uniref:CXXC-type zinc finger protein 1 n=1 Tax=Drosophila willistoni TaxID=7260 RepID=B4NE15_DROWI|nr:CXXC-type zinc finger protein 1 [Drosophila willistoni]EDW81984.1 uncharacterized protein Dwil_GK25558 [Drosophila willistoni]